MVSFYTPLLDTEQEALQRMIEAQQAYVEIVGWGYHSNPTITVGDKRLQVRFRMEFSKPEGLHVPVRQFTLRLKLRDGRTVFTDTKSTVYNNQALPVTAGLQIDLVWDIALDSVSYEFQKLFLRGPSGRKVMEIQGGAVTRPQAPAPESAAKAPDAQGGDRG